LVLFELAFVVLILTYVSVVALALCQYSHYVCCSFAAHCLIFPLIVTTTRCICEPGSSVGIATGYSLEGPGMEFRWERNFPPVQTGPGAHPASCTMGTGFFSGGKVRPGRAADHSPLLAPRSWKSRAMPLPPSGPQPGL